jgi:hypothetical protein
MAISGEPGPKVGEPLPTWQLLFASSFTRSDSPFLLPARVGGSSMFRGSSDSEVSPIASPKDNKAVPALRSRPKKKKTEIRRKKRYDAETSV